MLDKIIRFSIKNKAAVGVMTLLLIIWFPQMSLFLPNLMMGK